MTSFLLRHPFYPYSGTRQSRAEHDQRYPLAEGSDGAAAKQAIETQWLPGPSRTSKPQMIFISAVSTRTARIYWGAWRSSRRLCVDDPRIDGAGGQRHSQRRIVSMLEGGYKSIRPRAQAPWRT